jgi:uncharacterized protein (TIGR04255 family)
MQPKRYAKPPIVEAIIDLQVHRPDPVEVDAIAGWAARLQERFPVVSPILTATFTIPEGGGAPLVTNEQVGSRLATSDNSRVVQVQQKGFTFSQLTQYTCWDDFYKEAKGLWDEYAASFPFESVSRIATRYINKIAIPEQRFELEDYFNLYPTYPRDINELINAVFMQFRQPVPTVPNASATVNFTSTVENPGTLSAQTAFVLDFDVAVEGAWSPFADEVWSALAEFRNVKNRYFEASITEKCRRLFE